MTARFHTEYPGTGKYPNKRVAPAWWNAYNTIKHRFSAAETTVTYSHAINAVAALFLFLSAVDPGHKILEQNGLLTTPPNDANCEVRSTLFRTQLIGT